MAVGSHLEILSHALEHLGLSAREVAVYRAAMGRAPRPVSRIANRAGVDRAHAYAVLSSLTERGLIEESFRKKVRHYCAARPEVVLSLLQGREKLLSEQRKSLESVLPKLFDELNDSPSIRSISRGVSDREAVELLLTELEKQPERDLRAFVGPATFSNDIERTRLFNLFERRRLDHGGKVFAISVEGAGQHPLSIPSPEAGREVRFAPSLVLDAEIFLLGSCTVFFVHNQPGRAYVLESELTSRTLFNVHRLVWNCLSEEGR